MIRSSKFPCKWTNCQFGFDNPEDLFNHLSDDHVGRKATNNLCLQCQWNNCGTVAAKRDHLASHLRVHLPLKPHQCPLCSKGFKRPQDLKKHERIHTVEHQSSLLSNQPGYKPVRRRRKTTTNPTISSNSYSSTTSSSNTVVSNSVPIKDQSEMSSELSSCSPSFSFGDSESSHPNNAMDTEEGQYYRNGYMHDPLQEFIDDVLLNQSLPNYDEDMMERLNSIAPILQYQQEQNSNNWTLPCEPESIPALQHWLEQLSASVQTDESIYPEILINSDQQSMKPLDISAPPQLLTTDDYDLYPKLDDNNVWTSPLASNTNQFPVTPKTNLSPVTFNINQQNTSTSESSAIHTPPHDEEEEGSKPPPLPPRKNINPQFWSPGYVHSPFSVDPPSSHITEEDCTPSEAINFSSPTVPKSQYSTAPAPTVVFETSQEQCNPPTPVIDSTSTVSFDDKKELIHMINVFSSAKGKQAYKKPPVQKPSSSSPSPTSSSPTSPSPSSSLIQTPSSAESSPTIKKQSVTVKATEVDYNEEEPEVKSPYADLVGLIRNMKVEDETTMRKRHVLLIDQLWKAVARTR